MQNVDIPHLQKKFPKISIRLRRVCVRVCGVNQALSLAHTKPLKSLSLQIDGEQMGMGSSDCGEHKQVLVCVSVCACTQSYEMIPVHPPSFSAY